MTDTSTTPEAEATTPGAQSDYFGVDTTYIFALDDGISYVEHKRMSEGDRRAFLNKTNKDVRVAKQTGDAIIRMAPGDERYELLCVALCGWNLMKEGSPRPFTNQNRDLFLKGADPVVIDAIEKDVREQNPWLNQNVTVEDIDTEIENLQTQRNALLDAEAGKASS